jgi:hypothetical protein
MKTCWGSGSTAPRILNPSIGGGEWSASRPGRFTPRIRTTTPPPDYPLDRKQGGLQRRSGGGAWLGTGTTSHFFKAAGA